MTANMPSQTIQDFITRWKESAAAERANYQLFLSELCDVLEVARPQPSQADDEQNAYVFERAVTFHNIDGSTSNGRIDLYKRGCFVLEAKQGSDQGQSTASLSSGAAEGQSTKGRKGRRGTATRGTRGWDVAMREAQGQAEQYVRALAPSEGNPPFVIVVDVGYSIEIYSDFSRAGKTYVPFPDARSHRILIDDLTRDETRERLRLVWTEPMALDPSRRSARVTRVVAERLAALARSLEDSGYEPERVANFLMRAIFTMFAEDVKLLPERGWTDLLESLGGSVEKFPQMVSGLWEVMNTGGFSQIMREDLLRFNGGLFESVEALPITEAQLKLLIEASKLDWREVEPAIFGTLLERALDPLERQMRGAHYTPRAYVERLVMPTVIEPLREEWQSVLAAAITLDDAGKRREAAEEVKAFHRRLCKVRVLDPACGSGNFLYVTLEHLKRLEGEVLDALHGFGDSQGILEDVGLTVDPHQLLGIEKNPRATAITDLVLWIGYLQWHFRTRGEARPPEPVIKKFHNIECRDAVLAYDAEEVVTDEGGRPVTRWDGRTSKQHPVTGEDVPDETARVPVLRYVNARKAEWPEADYIVGNPPFIGSKRMRELLGDGYIDALQAVMPEVPQATDFVLRWWHLAAEKVRAGEIKRFGLITTNSINQPYNRRAIEPHLISNNPLSIVFAIPNHPWVDSVDGAAVRVAMTVGEKGIHQGHLLRVIEERLQATDGGGDLVVSFKKEVGQINVDLTVGVNVTTASVLRSNLGLCSVGIKTIGEGFVLSIKEATALGMGASLEVDAHIHPYLNGRDLASKPRGMYVLDLYGLSEANVMKFFPAIYQHLLLRVKPERELNRNKVFRGKWWIIGHPRQVMRDFLAGLGRYVATIETSKHRFFCFLPREIMADSTIVTFGFEDAFFLGVLSSHIHVAWALATGSRLGVGNDPRYNKTRCFETFPFPDCTEQQKTRIRELGEQLDAHRKRQQALHPSLTITEMYNVLEKLRADEHLNDKDRAIHEQGLISILRQLHDDLDRAVFDAYGWPHTLTDEEILERLVRLNSERAAEERSGLVRWLRPEYQRPAEGTPATFGKDMEAAAALAPAAKKETKLVWPKSIPEQARAVRQALAASMGVVTPEQLAKKFARANAPRVRELLQTLVSLGQAREVEEGRFVV